jgi:hypothetical protein
LLSWGSCTAADWRTPTVDAVGPGRSSISTRFEVRSNAPSSSRSRIASRCSALRDFQHVGEVVGATLPGRVLTLADGTRRELPRALFSDPAVFSDLGRALSRPEVAIPRDA